MAWGNVARVRAKYGKRMEDGLPRWESRELGERVLAMLASKKEPELTLELDVPAAALTATRYWFEFNKGDKSRWPDWMERWTAHDLGFAVRALFACMRLQHADESDQIFIQSCPPSEGLAMLGPLPFTLLARAIAAAPKKGYEAARAAAPELAANASLETRLMLAYVLPRERFAAKDAAWGLETNESEGALPLAYAFGTAPEAECIRKVSEQESTWAAWSELSRASMSVAQELDAARALPIVRLMMVGGSWGEWSAREARALLAIEPSAAVARVAAEMLESHHAGAVLRPWLASRPELAIPAVAERLTATKDAMATQSLLSSLVLAHRDLAAAATKRASPAARAILEHEIEVCKPLPDASLDELPPALAAPPWREPKKTPKVVPYPELERLPFVEKIHWGDDDPRAIADAVFPPGWGHSGPRSKANDAKIARKLKGERWVGLFQLTQLTDEGALALLRDWGPDAFYYRADDVEGILARHGIEHLDVALRFAEAKPGEAAGLERVESPRIAPFMAHVAVDLKKTRDTGQRWLARFPEAAAIGLMPELARRGGKERATIEEAIRLVAREAPDVVASVAKRYGADQPIAALLASSSFAKLPKKLPKMPAFWSAAGLPRPKLAGANKVLPLSAMEDLGTYLALSKREAYHPALFSIRAACDRPSLARFAWALFSEWLGAGASTKDDFGFFVLGVFGDDAAARALQPMIKEWAPGGFPQRAQMGVDVLAALGTHAALEMVYRTATKVRSRALAAHADKTLQKIAARLKLSRDDLADRLVPDLDLDARGTRTFDYGKRKFVVRFDEHLKPTPDLPKPAASDDEELAAQAYADFKELKTRAREVMSEQTKRLEQALATRRKYDPAAFRERFIEHPVLRMFGARLVWGAYAGNTLRESFRIDGDSLVGLDGRPIALREGETVGLVHPADIDERTRAAWSDVLAELEIIQPVVQLGREVFAPDEAALAKIAGKTVASGKMLGLERRLWKRGDSPQGGVFASYEKTLGDVRATLTFDPGIYMGDPKEYPEQKLEGVTMVRGKTPARLADLDAALASELLADLSSLL